MSRHMYLPRGKRIVLYRSGDKFYPGTPFTLNPRYIKNVNDLLSEATTKVDAVWGAVRSIHTPNTGTAVNTLDAINPQGAYVAAGAKGFKHIPGGYENIGRPVLIRKRRTGHSRNPSRRSLYGHDKIKVTVYRNGDDSSTYPFTFTTEDYGSWEKALDRLSEDVPRGPIRRIFYLSGNRVQSPQDLINHGTYVVAGEGEAFEPAQYGDVTLGVDDGGVTFGKADRRWSLSSQTSQDFGGRLSKTPGTFTLYIPKTSERKEGRKEWETERWNNEEEVHERNWDNEDEIGDEAENAYYANYREIEEEEVGEEDSIEQESEWISERELDEGYARRGESKGEEERNEDDEENSEVIVLGDRTSSKQASPEGVVGVSLTPSSSSSRKPRGRVSHMPLHIPESESSRVDYLELRNHSPTFSSLPSSTNDLDYRFYEDSAFTLHTPIAEEREEDLEEHEDDWREDESVRSRSRVSIFDSGHASLLSDEDRPDSVFRAKTRLSRPATQAREVDYDTDDGGVYKAKHRSDYAAQEILESSATNIELPVDLVDATEVQEEIAA